MIKSLDLREIDSSKKTSKTVLFCGTELDKKILDKKLCGVYKLNIEDYPNAYETFANEISLPLYSQMTPSQHEYVIRQYTEILKEYI